MKNRKKSYHNRRGFPAFGIFLTGFLAGVLIPNLMWKMEWRQKTASSLYLIGIYADSAGEGTEYLRQVFRMRGSLFLLSAFSGISVFGVPLAVAALLTAGVLTGLLLAVSVLQFGLQGGLVGAALMFPQYLIYVPCLFYFMSLVYRQSLEIWRSRGLIPDKMSGYAVHVFFCGVAYTLGIILEIFVNPKVVEIVLTTLKLF